MVSVDAILRLAQYYVNMGCVQGTPNHLEILRRYNYHKPLAMNYTVKPTDHWCATFISTLFIVSGHPSYIGGTECSCGRMIELMQKKGIWIEDSKITPQPGDIIFYDWDGKDGWPEHVGIVEAVYAKTAVVIEGNYNKKVDRRTINLGWDMIRGYGRPIYDIAAMEPPSKPATDIAREVIQGKWGTGRDRVASLKAAGYDPVSIQNLVNAQLSKKLSDTDIAKEVINGEWGNGIKRTNALIRAGYDHKAIQREVNRLCSV